MVSIVGFLNRSRIHVRGFDIFKVASLHVRIVKVSRCRHHRHLSFLSIQIHSTPILSPDIVFGAFKAFTGFSAESIDRELTWEWRRI